MSTSDQTLVLHLDILLPVIESLRQLLPNSIAWFIAAAPAAVIASNSKR